MTRPAACLCALFGAALLAGCSEDAKPKGYPKVDYGYAFDTSNLPSIAKQFLDAPPAAKTRTVAADKMPLTFIDLDGKTVDLAAYRGRANVVLVMTKGMPQSPGGVFCPGCLAQMNALVANAAEFKKRGAEVLVVFPGPSEKAGEFLTTAKAREGDKASPIPLLLDMDMAAVTVLGITGDRAKPSTYVLDRKGNVVYAYVGEHTTDRPSIKALLGQLDKLDEKK
ncbi:peroxiredoxin family protein [Gemmata sp.]|uniref:peroxiredoxin family protein n=1 Tax=Gemmata sp. TaxID=1914242 RepID=UPI003F715782